MRDLLIASPTGGPPDIAHADALVLAHPPAAALGWLPALCKGTALYVRVVPGAVDLDAARAAPRDGFHGGFAETAEAAAILTAVFGRGPGPGCGPRRPLPLG
ncbi:hypothetical protein [Methylobacterium sp. WL120]|uniref:hypothetical protein n=1 Tax=Methylobacterium sp. WL120 TaxID=2603887 RepID=UPI0011CAE4AF|nr:hypothetical protein [Methylobacterium sp. WL120]TXM64995.1 hypothetical protein FV229_16800 [Methylobacterium sp. WL120]